jgi:CubicO group peptidase (beta-lactamase class C family)
MTMTDRGVDAGAVEALLTRARKEIDQGPLPSCQIALAKDGELIAFEAFGDATTTTRYNVFSCTKPLVAGVMWQLIGEGAVDVSQRVVDVIPEFGTNGKDVVTIEQVMLHTGGFPHAPLKPPEWDTREGRVEAFARWKLNWEPGTAYEYHATSGHWVLAEIIDRITGQDYRDVVEERITGPAGLPRVLGIPLDDQDDIAVLQECGTEATPDELEAVLGVRELDVGEVTNDALLGFNLPEIRAVGVPGGGAVMTAADLALWYQHLLHDPTGTWDPAVRADAMTNVRNRLPDVTMGLPANRTLGLMQAGDDGFASFRGFGKTTSPTTVGHGGAAGQIAWVDPVSGISVGYVTNGIDINVIKQFKRVVAISSRAGACAGPAAG